jgi:hypothetical protein
MMHRRTDDGCSVIPLYIGKAETIGRGGQLSANLRNLYKSKDKFARWGDNYAYHIGDLSAAVLMGHHAQKTTPKYNAWASKMFKTAKTQHPQLGRVLINRAS